MSNHQTHTYTAYGYATTLPSEKARQGFNGEFPDALTGLYFLGSGYRAYETKLMRFISPDSLSPFAEGALIHTATAATTQSTTVTPRAMSVYAQLLLSGDFHCPGHAHRHCFNSIVRPKSTHLIIGMLRLTLPPIPQYFRHQVLRPLITLERFQAIPSSCQPGTSALSHLPCCPLIKARNFSPPPDHLDIRYLNPSLRYKLLFRQIKLEPTELGYRLCTIGIAG